MLERQGAALIANLCQGAVVAQLGIIRRFAEKREKDFFRCLVASGSEVREGGFAPRCLVLTQAAIA